MLTRPLRLGGAVSFADAASRVIPAVQSRIGRQLWVIGAVLALFTLVGAGLTIWDVHRRTLQDATDDTRTLGVVLAEQTTRYVEVIDLLLREVQARTLQLDISTPQAFRQGMAGEAIHRYLDAGMQNLPQAHAITVIDAEGAVLNKSRDFSVAPRIHVADRDYFQHARDHADSRLFISEPTITRSTGVMAVFLSRRISGPAGGFLGVVVAAIDVDYLLDFYRTITRQRRFAVTLLRPDGLVLARYPDSTVAGQSMLDSSPWHAAVTAGGGSYPSPGYLSGASSIVSVSPLRDYPLVLDVSIHRSDVLATWWCQATYTAGGSVLLAGAWVALFWLTARQVRRQTEQNETLSLTADALRKSQAQLHDFASLASDWFWEQDAELRFVSVGLGTPLSPMFDQSHLGKRRWEIIDTTRDAAGWEVHQRDVLAGQPFRDFRFEQIDVHGRLHHVSVSGVPVYDGGGHHGPGALVGYRGIGSDITARIEAEQDLKQAKDRAERAEAMLQDAIDSISEGFVIYDAEDRLVTCNEGYCQVFSADRAEMVPGTHFADVLRQGLAKGTYPDVIDHQEAWVDMWVRRLHETTGDTEQPLKDGKWVRVSNRRMRNGCVAGLRIDITALKQAQAALRDSEAHLDRAQEIADIGSWELDNASGAYVWSRNLYRIRGLPTEFQPSSANTMDSVHTDDLPVVLTWIADLQAGRTRSPIEVRSTRPDGDVRVLRLEGRPLVDPDGAIRRLAGTTQDVTERRLIERQLAQAQKMEAIGNLTGGMAHDFNNVLGVIMGNLDLLQRLVRPDAAAAELCGEALDGATRCAELIRRLLAFARRQSLRPEKIDVNALVGNIGLLLRRTLGEAIALRLELDGPLWPVMADAAQLEAALVNLATNARDAMPKGGQLDIATRNVELDAAYVMLHPDVRPGGYALIEITDTGTGIPPEIIGRIFEPFFTTKEAGKGTGLGLSMTFGFVKQSDGHLSVYTEPGRGSTFRLYLPRCDAGAAASTGESEAGTATAGTAATDDGTAGDKTKTAGDKTASDAMAGAEAVLVVEDNVRLRLSASRQLKELGYRVREAEHAGAALAILASVERIDLLFTDVVMPGTMDGLDLARHATGLRRGLKVLLTSGFPGARSADQRTADCPFLLLNKPYRRDELARAVRGVLDMDADQATTGLARPAPWLGRQTRDDAQVAVALRF